MKRVGFADVPSRQSRLFRVEKSLVGLTVVSLLFLFLISKVFMISINGLSVLLVYGLLVVSVHLLVFISALTKYKDLATMGKPLSAFSDKELPFVSCMVAVHNEEEFVTRCLDSTFAQHYDKKEIIVVDDCSTDKTLHVLRKYQKTHPELLIIALTENVGKKGALCEAMAKAKGDIFAHTDSDSIWHPEAIERIVRIFVNNEDVGAVSGHGRAQNASTNVVTKVQDAWMEGQFSIRKAFESAYGTVTCVSGPLAVYRKSAIYNFLPAWQYDQFLGSEFRFATDRTLTAMLLGAPWLHHKLVRKYRGNRFLTRIYQPRNWQVVYSRSARSQTIVPDTVRKFLKQQTRWKKSFIRNAFFNSPFFWHKSLPVAFVYYAHILFVVCAPLVAARIFLTFRDHYLFVILAYLLSVAIIGLLFALVLRFEDRECKYWYYRPLMSLFSAICLSWVIIYSALTIKKMKWSRG